jgi:hypothetical protein
VPQLLLLDHRLPLLLLVLLRLLHLQQQLPCKLHWAATSHHQPLDPDGDLQTQITTSHQAATASAYNRNPTTPAKICGHPAPPANLYLDVLSAALQQQSC